jgi:hypothetical protein
VLWCALLSGPSSALDVRVASEFHLECRFNPNLMEKKPTFYWIRSNVKEKDNVAIGESPLEKNYRCVSHAIYFPAFSPTIRSDGSIYWRPR